MSISESEDGIIELGRNDEFWSSNHSNPSFLAIRNDFYRNIILTPVSH